MNEKPFYEEHPGEVEGRNHDDQYVYRQLNPPTNIRVVVIFPAEKESDPIQCELREEGKNYCFADLSYQTLSYAWGSTYEDDSHLNSHITCDGRTLKVTAHLHQALLQIRTDYAANKHDASELPLWVDAICINQRDSVERSQQIQQMGEIFGDSSRLIIWLGDFLSPAEDLLLVKALDRLAVVQMRSPNPQHQLWEEEIPDVLRKVRRQPWFQRRWVIQEVLVTKPSLRWFFFGQHAVEYNALSSLLLFVDGHRDSLLDYWEWFKGLW